MKLIPVSVAMFVRPSSEGFQTWVQERTDGPLKGFWEFPGGKIEAGETAWQALVREIKEETNVTVTGAGRLLGIFPHDYGEKRVLLHIYQVDWEDDLLKAPGQVVTLGEDWKLPLLPANFRLVEYLRRALYDGGNERTTT